MGQYLANLWSGLGTLAAFLFVLSIVVFVHEYGHFKVARWCGVRVQAFSIGFGREVLGFVDKHGTRWRLNWMPLGGYVKFMDDENSASMPVKDALERMTPEERAGSFHAKPLWQKAAVIAAGPIANFLLAIALLAGIFMTVGVPVTPPKIDDVVAGGAADKAGLRAGDLVVSINGVAIESFSDIQRVVSTSADTSLRVEYDRNGLRTAVDVTPERKEIPDGFGGKMRIGMMGIKRNATAVDWTYKKYGPIDAVVLGVKESYYFVERNLSYLKDVIIGREKADQLGGPIRIADVAGKVATAGIIPLLHLTAMISVSIGLFNLFPIPPLDGGHLLFYGAEAIRRRPLSDDVQGIGFRIGLALILTLAVYAMWNDLGIVKRWLGG